MDNFNQKPRLVIGNLIVEGLMVEAQRDLLAAEMAAAQEKVKGLEAKLAEPKQDNTA